MAASDHIEAIAEQCAICCKERGGAGLASAIHCQYAALACFTGHDARVFMAGFVCAALRGPPNLGRRTQIRLRALR